jgi:hypothetical protein
MKTKRFIIESYYDQDFSNVRKREYFGSIFAALSHYGKIERHGETNGVQSMRFVLQRNGKRPIWLRVSVWSISRRDARKRLDKEFKQNASGNLIVR